jgi:uncharacterized protein (UPF0333 family)
MTDLAKGLDKDHYKTADLVGVRNSQSAIGLPGVDDSQAFSKNNSEYTFYQQFLNALNDPNPALAPMIFNIISNSKLTLEQFTNRVARVMKSLKVLMKDKTGNDKLDEIRRLNEILRSNPLTASLYIDYDKAAAQKEEAAKREQEAAEAAAKEAAEVARAVKYGLINHITVFNNNGGTIADDTNKDTFLAELSKNNIIKQLKSYIEINIDNKVTLNASQNEQLTNAQALDLFRNYISTLNDTEKQQIIAIDFNRNLSSLEAANNVTIYKNTLSSLSGTSGGGKYGGMTLLQLGGAGALEYYSKLSQDLKPSVDRSTDGKEAEIDTGDKNIQKKLRDFEQDPIFGLDVEKITPTDRAVFIALTYILRSISLFLLNWGINSNAVTNFEKAFLLYFTCYITLFIIIVLLVNVGKDTIFFRLLFYYIDAHHNGWGRVILHILFQLALMPVIWMLKTNNNSLEITDFKTGQRIYNVMSIYTFFIWIFSSIIALQY